MVLLIKKVNRMFDDLGKIIWLWMNSPLHREWPTLLLADFVVPPVKLGQYTLLERDGMPVAYCSWAWLSQEDEINYVTDPANLPLQNWSSGDRLWFVDWVAPFGRKDSFDLRTILNKKFSHSIARALRVKKNSNSSRVMEFKGGQADHEDAHRKFDEYFHEFFAHLNEERNSATFNGKHKLPH